MKTKLLLTAFLFLVLLGGIFVTLPMANAAPNLARSVQNVIFAYGPETVTLTATQTITPGRSLVLFNPGSALTVTLATGGALPGDQLLLINTAAVNTVVLSTNTTLAADLTLEDRDGVKFTYADSVWVHEYTADNNP